SRGVNPFPGRRCFYYWKVISSEPFAGGTRFFHGGRYFLPLSDIPIPGRLLKALSSLRAPWGRAGFHVREARAGRGLGQTTPWSSMASATLVKPAMLAPWA